MLCFLLYFSNSLALVFHQVFGSRNSTLYLCFCAWRKKKNKQQKQTGETKVKRYIPSPVFASEMLRVTFIKFFIKQFEQILIKWFTAKKVRQWKIEKKCFLNKNCSFIEDIVTSLFLSSCLFLKFKRGIAVILQSSMLCSIALSLIGSVARCRLFKNTSRMTESYVTVDLTAECEKHCASDTPPGVTPVKI